MMGQLMGYSACLEASCFYLYADLSVLRKNSSKFLHFLVESCLTVMFSIYVFSGLDDLLDDFHNFSKEYCAF